MGVQVDVPEVGLASTLGFQLIDGRSGAVVARGAPGETVKLLSAPGAGIHILAAGAGTTVRGPLLARPAPGGQLRVGDAAYRGEVLVSSSSGGRLTAVNTVDIESYLLGVVPREIGKVGPELLEAAKAQAVAARTYAVANLGRRAALGFDVYASTQDQVYGGIAAEWEPVSRAVRETAGEILTYDGNPIEAFYHSTCAGRTAAIEEVWNERPRPYLKSVVDVDPRTGIAYDSVSSRFRWTTTWSAPELSAILNRTLADSLPAGVGDLGEILDLRVVARTPSERVRALDITTSRAGVLTVGRDRIRWILLTPSGAPLNSSKFDVSLQRDSGGRVTQVTARGGGWGHGIGMCQVGAMGRARTGQDYRTILQAYYAPARITLLYR